MDITITTRCNNDCFFCPRKNYLELIACTTLSQCYKDIENTRKKSDRVVLSGGEITVIKELWKIIDFCKQLNFREIGIITNGRRLKEASFAERIAISGVKDFAISLYSVNENIHDLITRSAGSCKETKQGIINLLKLSSQYNISLRVNFVLNYWNFQDTANTLNTLLAWGIKNFTIAEQIIINKKSKHLKLKEVIVFLRNIEQWNLKAARLCLRGFPPCLFKSINTGYADQLILKHRDPFIVLEKQEIDTLVKDARKKRRYLEKFKKLFTQSEKCRACLYKDQCLGIQKAYL